MLLDDRGSLPGIVCEERHIHRITAREMLSGANFLCRERRKFVRHCLDILYDIRNVRSQVNKQVKIGAIASHPSVWHARSDVQQNLPAPSAKSPTRDRLMHQRAYVDGAAPTTSPTTTGRHNVRVACRGRASCILGIRKEANVPRWRFVDLTAVSIHSARR